MFPFSEIPLEKYVNASINILVVDDQSFIRELSEVALTGAGYTVVTAPDGAAAWNALKHDRFDLVITDHQMPKVTGLELIQKIRSEKMEVPIILISATMPVEELSRQSVLKLDAALAKPFVIEELLATVKNVLAAIDVTKRSQGPKNGTLPGHEIAQGERPAARPTRIPANAPRRILVVNDDRTVRQFDLDLLTDSGYQAEGADDGAAGWEALQAKEYDLVVTDNKMPRMTGVEMIAKLRAVRMTIPVIMATGALPMNDFERRPWLKPDAMLQRPFATETFLETVRRILRDRGGNEPYTEMLLPL